MPLNILDFDSKYCLGNIRSSLAMLTKLHSIDLHNNNFTNTFHPPLR